MFQKKCIVCNQYKLSDEFGDELEKKSDYGLICRDCLIDRQFLTYEETFINPNDISREEDLDVPKEFQDEKLFTELKTEIDFINRNENNKIPIAYLPLDTVIRNKLFDKKIRTMGGVKFETGANGVEPLRAANLTATETHTLLNAVAEYLKINPILISPETVSNKILGGKPNTFLIDVLKKVSTTYNVSIDEMLSPLRLKRIVQARFVAIHILRQYLSFSYPMIARFLRRDHTTIIHADQTFQKDKNFNPQTEQKVIKNIIKGFKLNEIVEKSAENKVNTLPDKLQNNETRETISPKISHIASTKISERNLNIFLQYKNGQTLEAISKNMNVTRERVRQITLKVAEIFAARQIILLGKRAPTLAKGVEIEKHLHAAAAKVQHQFKYPKKVKTPYKLKGWSRHHEFCKSCGTTKVKHFKNGLCEICGRKPIYGEEREQIIASHHNICDSCKISREESRSRYGRDFYLSRVDNSVLCRECFRSKTGKKLGMRPRK